MPAAPPPIEPPRAAAAPRAPAELSASPALDPRMPPPNTATLRAIEELASLVEKPKGVELASARALPLGARAPETPPPRATPAWLKNLVFALLMLAATALGWMIRDLFS